MTKLILLQYLSYKVGTKPFNQSDKLLNIITISFIFFVYQPVNSQLRILYIKQAQKISTNQYNYYLLLQDIQVMNLLSPKQFQKLAEGRGIKIKNDKLQLDRLLKAKPHELTPNIIKQACADIKMAEKLQKTIQEIQELSQRQVTDRFYTIPDYVSISVSNEKKVRKELKDEKRERQNIFEDYHRTITYIDNKAQISFDAILLITSPVDIIEVNILRKDTSVPLEFSPRKISKTFYAFSFIGKQLLIDNPVESLTLQIKTIDYLFAKKSIVIKQVYSYFLSYYRAGMIIIEFSQSELIFQTRTTGILYSVGALVFRNEKQKDSRFIDYQWLTLFYSLCFVENRIRFEQIVNFKLSVPDDKKAYSLSRFYIYLLYQLSKQTYKVSQFLYLKNELMDSLQFPIIKGGQSDHKIELQQIFLQFCLNYSLKVDKKVQTKAGMFSYALLHVDDMDFLRFIKEVMEKHPNIFGILGEKQTIKLISNQYILANTAIWLLSEILRQKNLKTQPQQQLVIKCLTEIGKKPNLDRDQNYWILYPTKQDIESILISKQKKFIIKDQTNCSIYYKEMKRLELIDIELYNLVYSISKPYIEDIYKKKPLFNRQLLACLTSSPVHQQDLQLLSNCYFPVESINSYQEVIEKRVIHAKMFEITYFDQYLAKFIEFQIDKTSSLNVIKYLSIIVNQTLAKAFPNKKQDIKDEFLQVIISKIDFKVICKVKNIEEQIIQLLSAFSKLQNRSIKETIIKLLKLIIKERNIKFNENQLQNSLQIKDSLFQSQNSQFYYQILKLTLSQQISSDKIQSYWRILMQKQNCGNILKNKKLVDARGYFTSMRAVVQKIESNNLFLSQLEELCKNNQILKDYQKEIQSNIWKVIDQCYQRFKHFKEKLRNIQEILQQFHFEFDLKKIVDFQNNMTQLKLKNIYQLQIDSKELRSLFEISIYVNELVLNSSYFQKENISKIQDFITLYEHIKTINKEKLNQFQQFQNYTYESFVELIKEPSIDKWCGLIFEKQNTIFEKINQLKQQILNKYYQIIISYLKIMKQMENSEDNKYSKFLSLYHQIQTKEKVYIKDLQYEIKFIRSQLIIDFIVESKQQIFKDQIINIIVFTNRFSQMFERISAANIDSEVIMSLKELTMSQVYSNINIQNIQQFQSVVSYLNQKKNNNNFKDFIAKVRKNITQHKIALSQNIIRCYSKYQQILQKKNCIQNKETSFKNEIELMFHKQNKCWLKNSFKPSLYCLQFHLNVAIKDHAEQRIYTMKQLKEIQEQCLIFKTEVQNSQVNQGLSKIFNKFLEFYQYLQKLRTYCQTMCEYGFDIDEIQLSIEINEKLDHLQQMSKKLQRESRLWKQKIKDYYKQSYLFTFYLGKDIRVLINQVSQKKMPKKIQSICSLTKEQLQQIYSVKRYSHLGSQNLKDQQRLSICIQFLEEIYRVDRKQKSQIKNRNRITLSFTAQSNYIYQFNSLKIPKVYEIFFCLQQTSLLELQIFLHRCFNTNSSIYYIIGAQFIRQELKNELFELIKSIQQGNKYKNIELRFIDSNRSDILYHHLQWCNFLEVVETKEANISKNIETNKNVVQNLLENVELVTSQRPGLGKTFYVQNQQKDLNKLVRFPIAGNIDFQNILNRLKRLNLKDKSILLQIGYLQKSKHQSQSINNIQKLQIFLTMILLLKAFYHNREYIYLKDIPIFIEIQNQLESEPAAFEIEIKINKSNLLQLLKSFKKHHHIKEFDPKQIKFDQQNPKEIFVLKYLEIYNNQQINKKNIVLEEIEGIIITRDLQQIQQFIQKNKYFYQQKYDQQTIKAKFIEKRWKNATKNAEILKIIKLMTSLDKDREESYQFYQSKINEQLTLLKQKVTLSAFPQNKVKLIEKHFINACKKTPSYRSYQQFIKNMFEKIKIFSKSYSLCIDQVQYYKRDYYLKKTDFGRLRQDFFKVLLQNTIKIIEETTAGQIQESKSIDQLERLQTGQFYANLSSSPTIILSSKDQFGYQFINRRAADVQFSIKSLIATSDLNFFRKVQNPSYVYRRIREDIDENFKIQAFEHLQGEKQQLKMMETLYNISGNSKFNKPLKQIYSSIKGFKDYKLTLDNFYKICYIIQRVNSFSPIILMGESGVGKTALLKFTVNQIYQQTLLVYNVHAGIHVEELEKWVEQIKEKAESKKDSRIWVFFDQFNTSQELSYIKQIVIDRRFQGEQLPKNILFLTACNPYRMKSRSANQVRAFNVKPPNLAMISLMWDYEQLREKQCESYCYKMLKDIPHKLLKETVSSIVKVHKHIHQYYQLSYASLRDVTRFKQLYFWFFSSIPRKPMENMNHEEEYSIENYKMAPQLRSIILAFCFVYQLKFSKMNQRRHLMEIVENEFQFKANFMQQVLKREQIDYVIRLKEPDMKIAYNKALRENLFTSFVCILNKIPVILIGSPGSSKSLSVKLINSNLRGKFSKNEFCKQFPQFMFHYSQGSQSSTSQSILKPFLIAQKPKPKDTEYLIVFDELGIAQKSIHNPTKVLHSKLQTESKIVSIIALSNHQLDCSKMSRFLVVQRQEPQRDELIETAQKIFKSFVSKDNGRSKIVKEFASSYEEFRHWFFDKIKNYYGQRDFYCSVRYICNLLTSKNEIAREQILGQAVRMNYDGLRNQEGQRIWSQKFYQCLKITPPSNYPQVRQVIKENLTYKDSRYLLFIVKQDSIIQYIIQNPTLEINQKKRKIKSIYCSPFLKDNQSQEYNIEFTSSIISQMSKGSIISIKDLNNSIQTSLYDLFNKSYLSISGKDYCRVVVGATSNPKCYVHSEFSVIIFMNEQNYRDIEGAFLNRFEKHFITILDELTSQQRDLLRSINAWIEKVQNLWKDKKLNSRENYLLNSNQYSLASLIIKYREKQANQKKLKLIKQKILQNSTSDFYILVNKLEGDLKQQVRQVKQQIKDILMKIQQDFPKNKPLDYHKRDLLIFTYGSIDDFKEINKYKENTKTAFIKINQAEKALKQDLMKQFNNKQNNIIQIYLNLQRQGKIINYLLHLLHKIKTQNTYHQQVRIVIQLNRYLLYKNKGDQIKKINISFLHDYQQYFYDPKIERIIASSNQCEAFKILFSQQLLEDIYQTYVFKLNIEVSGGQSSNHYITTLINLFKQSSFVQRLTNAIHSMIENQQINYSQIIMGKKDDSQQAQNSLLSSTMKEIFINYLKPKIVKIVQRILHIFCQKNLILKLSSKQQLQKKHFSEDLKNDSFCKSFSAQQNIVKSQGQDCWKLVLKQLEKKIEGEENKEVVFKIQNLFFFYPETSNHVKYLYKVDKSLPLDNLEVSSHKIFASDKQLDQQTLHQEQQNQIQNFINKNHMDWLQQVKNDSPREFLLLNDIIKFHLNLLGLDSSNSASITEIFLHITGNRSNFTQKLLILVFKREFSKAFYEIAIQLQRFYEIKQIKDIISRQMQKQQEMPHCFCYFINVLLSSIFKCISIQKYKQKKAPNKQIACIFSEFSCSTYEKAEKKLYEQSPWFKDLREIPRIARVQNHLINLFQRIRSRENCYQILQEYINFQENKFSYLRITRFCCRLLQKLRKNGETENQIIQFLACNLFGEFAEQSEDIETIKQQMYRFCFELSEKYPNFANLLPIKYFPSLFYQYFVEDQSINQSVIQQDQILSMYLKIKEEKNILPLKNSQITNLKIALGLYFRSVISKIVSKIGYKQIEAYSKEHQIIKKYNESYKLIQKNIENTNNSYVSEIFSWQFLKIYYEQYIIIIMFHQEIHREQKYIFQGINNFFYKHYRTNQLCKHLQIYLLKFIHRRVKDAKQYKLAETIEHKRSSYPWLNSWLQFLMTNKKQDNYQLPLDLFDKHQEVNAEYYKIKQSRFKQSQTKQFVRKCLKEPRKTYRLLTIFATFLCIDEKEDFRISISGYLKQIQELSMEENKIIKTLLLCYLNQKISSIHLHKIAEYRKKLPLLNFLNLICAYRTQNCSFIEMFFSKDGKLQDSIKEKYLFGTINNPQLVRCLILKQNQSERYAYSKCINCDYLKKMLKRKDQQKNIRISVISSKILVTQQNCPFCGQDLNEECTELDKHILMLVKKGKFIDQRNPQNYNTFELKGYHEGKSLSQIKKYNEKSKQMYQQQIYGSNAQSIERSKNVLQMIQFFIWHILKQINFTQINIFQTPNTLIEIYTYFQTQVIKRYNIQQKDQASWMYKVAQILQRLIIEESTNGMKNSLLNQAAKINFEIKFDKMIISSIYLQYQRAIKANKVDRYPSNQNILEETGIADQHHYQYKLIKLFKLVTIPQITSLQLDGLEYLVHSYHPLYYICKNIEKWQAKYQSLRKIYTFIYKIWLQFNFQLKREVQKLSIKNILQTIENEEQRVLLLEQLQAIHNDFKEIWKQDIGYQFSNFILDNKNKQGFMTQFVLQTAKQYNEECLKLQQILRKHYKKDEKTAFFSSQKVNPTLIEDQSFWKLSSETVLEKIEENKYNSITYGISKYQLEYNSIQYLIVKQLRQTNYLVIKKNQFKYFYFIDDDSEIEVTLQGLLNERLSIVEKQAIQRQYQKNKGNNERFLNKLLESIQKMICYLKYFKDNLEGTIGEFIRCQRQNHESFLFVTGADLSLILDQNEQMQVHPLKHLDDTLLKDVFSKLSLRKLISLQQYLTNLLPKKKQSAKIPEAQKSGVKQSKKGSKKSGKK